jgi:hypothetical protein
MAMTRTPILITFALSAFLYAGCGDDDDGANSGPQGAGARPADNVGSTCTSAAACYPGIDRVKLAGEVQCLDRVDDGYCTHTCETDEDCCAVDGECKTDFDQVCSPFESAGTKMCFLGCEGRDVERWNVDGDENEYCQRLVSPDFICRASGGGSENRKVCVPGDCDVGEACAADGDCADGLTCNLAFRGGYCGRAACAANADCPTGSVCVAAAGANYCFKSCTQDSECSACRPWDLRATCAAGATFVESGTSGNVCVPPAQ